MHSVARLNEAGAPTPPLCQPHTRGFTRATYVDRAMGSVHMGAGICRLEPGGHIARHLRSFEESFYLLAGELTVLIGDQAYVLSPGHFGLIVTGTKHALRSAGSKPGLWPEMQVPQPRPLDYGRDTFFVGGDFPAEDAPPEPSQSIGHFDETQFPRPGGPSEIEGFNTTTGVALAPFAGQCLMSRISLLVGMRKRRQQDVELSRREPG